MSFAEYANYDALGLAELVAKKHVGAIDLVDEAIARIEKHNPKLNAVVSTLVVYGAVKSSAPVATPQLMRRQRSSSVGPPGRSTGCPLRTGITEEPSQGSTMVVSVPSRRTNRVAPSARELSMTVMAG